MITVEQIRKWEIENGESFIEYHQYDLNPETHYQTLLKIFPELEEKLKEIYEENRHDWGIELITFEEYISYPNYPDDESFSEQNYEKFLQVYCDMINQDVNLIEIVAEELKNR